MTTCSRVYCTNLFELLINTYHQWSWIRRTNAQFFLGTHNHYYY